MRREICGECGAPISDDGTCDCTELLKRDEALLWQALEALEYSDWYIGQLELIVYSHDDTETHDARAKVQSTIAALRERLGEGAEP